MKRVLLLTVLTLFVVFSVQSTYAFITKGDTLVIEQADADAVPFNEIIAADTLADGSHAHAVYELVPDGWYSMSATLISATYNLNLVGGKRSEGQVRPTVLVKEDFGGWNMFQASQDFTMKSIHWMQAAETAGGNIGAWARGGVNLADTNQTIILHDLIWDFNTGNNLAGGKDGLDLRVTNCLIRFSGSTNNTRWDGQGFDFRAADVDTIIFQNCTWLCYHTFVICPWQAEEAFFKLDHCTFANGTAWPIHNEHWLNAEFTNNLFYNANTLGEPYVQRSGQDTDNQPFGIINIDTLFIDSLGVVNDAFESARSVLVSNNNNFVSPNIEAYWAEAAADTAYHDFGTADGGYMNDRTQAMFADDATWPGLVWENQTDLDPGFTDLFDYSDSLIQYSKCMWIGAAKTKLFTDPDGEPLIPTDPMVYDLSYSNPTLLTASTSGGPVGDLTWFAPEGYNSVDVTVGVEDKGPAKAQSFALEQNYPNPFNPTTQIKFNLNSTADVQLNVYNMLGQKVRTLVNKQMASGSHTVKFNGLNDQGHRLSSGMYIYQLQAGDVKETKKMMLMK